MAIIDLEQAKRHLRLPEESSDYDAALEPTINAADAIVLDYLKRDSFDEWSDGSPAGDPAPQYLIAQAAVLEVVGYLWRFRGDQDNQTREGPITPTVENMLRRLRDPALA